MRSLLLTSFYFIPCSSVPVAANKEKYLNPITGVCAGKWISYSKFFYDAYLSCVATFLCAGLVDNVFVPAGTAIDSSFAVLQEPFVVQTMTEAAAVVNWKKIPKWCVNNLSLLGYTWVVNEDTTIICLGCHHHAWVPQDSTSVAKPSCFHKRRLFRRFSRKITCRLLCRWEFSIAIHVRKQVSKRY